MYRNLKEMFANQKIVYSFEFGKEIHGFKFMFMHCKYVCKNWK